MTTNATSAGKSIVSITAPGHVEPIVSQPACRSQSRARQRPAQQDQGCSEGVSQKTEVPSINFPLRNNTSNPSKQHYTRRHTCDQSCRRSQRRAAQVEPARKQLPHYRRNGCCSRDPAKCPAECISICRDHGILARFQFDVRTTAMCGEYCSQTPKGSSNCGTPLLPLRPSTSN